MNLCRTAGTRTCKTGPAFSLSLTAIAALSVALFTGQALRHLRRHNAFPLTAARLAPSTSPVGHKAALTARADDTEFVGPFPSWANVRTLFGAAGDGITDDTTAIQNGINALGDRSRYVLYFPSGTYRISGTLSIAGKINIALVGEDPATTTIKWAGAASQDMLYLNGTRYSRFQRVTWDGGGFASAGINQGWDGHICCGGTGNEYADLVFKDLQYGIRAGTIVTIPPSTKSYQDDNSSITRVKFYRCSQACVSVESWNALEWEIRDSEFFDSRLGVTNEYGAGNYHVNTSVFHNNSYADVSIKMPQAFSLRGNTSIGSRKFLIATSNGAGSQHTLQANTIINTRDAVAIDFENIGPLIMLDNYVQARSGVEGPVVYQTARVPGPQAISLGNTWNVINPVAVTGPSARYWTLDDVVVPSLNLTAPALPSTPRNMNRTIIEVPTGAATVVIQNAINTAALAGNRTVVHLQGEYTLTSLLTVSGGAQLQILGDTRATTLVCAPGLNAALQLEALSRAVLADFTIDCSGGTGIDILGADQPGARVWSDQLLMTGPLGNSILAEGLSYSNVYIRDSAHYSSPESGGYDVLVDGGGAQGGRVLVDGGVSSAANPSEPGIYHVQNGGKLVIFDRWYEGNGSNVLNFAANNGYITINGSMLTPYTNAAGPTATFNGFTGRAAIINSITQNRWRITQSPGSSILMLGLNAYTVPWLSLSGSGGKVRLLNSIQGVNAWTLAPDIGIADASYIRTMLAQLREEVPVMGLPTSPIRATNVQIYRVGMIHPLIGLRIRQSGTVLRASNNSRRPKP